MISRSPSLCWDASSLLNCSRSGQRSEGRTFAWRPAWICLFFHLKSSRIELCFYTQHLHPSHSILDAQLVSCSVPVPPLPPTNAPPGSPGRQCTITMAIWTQISHRAVRCDWHVLRWDGTKCQSDRVFSCFCFSPPCSGGLFPHPRFCSDYRHLWRERVLDLLSWLKNEELWDRKKKPSLVNISF